MIGLSCPMTVSCGADLSLFIQWLVFWMCVLTAFLLGLMIVLKPKGFPTGFFPVWVFPAGNCLMVYPRKSKPTFPAYAVNVWVILVFVGLRISPICLSHSVIFCVAFSTSSFFE